MRSFGHGPAILAMAFGLLLAGPAPAQPPEALRAAQEILDARPWATDDAWAALSAGGLPLVGPHPDDASLARVTFAVKAPSEAGSVRLDSVINAPYARRPVADYVRDFTLPMQPMGDSRIWTLTLDVPRDVQAVYSFLVDTPAGQRRRGDPENRRSLGGEASEAVLVLDRAPDRSVLRPRPEPAPADALVVESEALQRPVFLRVFRAPGTPVEAPLVVLYDSFLWEVRAPAWQIAANLADAGRLPPVTVVLIDQLDEASAAHRYADQSRFLAEELLPALEAEGLRPQRVVVGGASRRGLAATRAALDHPGLIDGVISLSGSFYWAPPDEAPQWLSRNLPQAGTSVPRFYLAAGSLEYVETSTNDGHVMLETNRAMADALERAGYDARLAVFPGGHDIAGWRTAFAEGLVALLGEGGE